MRSMYIPFGESAVSWRDVAYTKIENLGSGGSSRVYLMAATSGPCKGIAFAVKVFQELTREDWRLNFMREVNFLRSCWHPAIMRVFDEGIYRDRFPFVVMEYLPETLSRAMHARPLSDLEKLSYTVQLLSALNYLSRLDPPVVHRDIKPSNVFLKQTSCVLGDFGLLLPFNGSRAKQLEAAAIPEMARHYRTPELVAYHNGGPKPPPASDVFQLGLVVAEMFTGKNPLQSDKPDRPVALSTLDDVPGALSLPIRVLIQEMLSVSPDARPSAATMLGKWQELHLELLRREHAARRAARLQ